MAKLNQIIAVEKGMKSQTYADITSVHHLLEKPPLLSGISRTYRPKDEEGDVLPPESTRVQIDVESALNSISTTMTRLFDVVATKDWANGQAKANVVVGGAVLLEAVPVTYLLFLEKQLNDLHTFVSKLPTLDPSELWTYDNNLGCYSTVPVQTVRTKKVLRNHVKAEATDKHPAQVDVYSEDVIVGTWTTLRFSGALPATRVAELTRRVETLQAAIKFAREEANSTVVEDVKIGTAVFQYLFAK